MELIPLDEYQKFESDYCECSACHSICKRAPGVLIPGDVERIADAMGETHNDGSVREAFLQEMFTVSLGVYHPRNDHYGNEELSSNGKKNPHLSLPVITPESDAGGCIFMDGDGKCMVHHVAPFGCKRMSLCGEDEFHPEKIKFVCKEIVRDRSYQKQWRKIAIGKTEEEIQNVMYYNDKMEYFRTN